MATPEGLSIALTTAARRGVDVRLMVADRGNLIWTREAGRSHYEQLLESGVEILEYERGLLHAKTLTVDGQFSIVGTANWDYRSLILNFEIGLAMFDSGLAGELESHFARDCEYARRISLEEWRQRPRLRVLKEEFWRMFAPML